MPVAYAIEAGRPARATIRTQITPALDPDRWAAWVESGLRGSIARVRVYPERRHGHTRTSHANSESAVLAERRSADSLRRDHQRHVGAPRRLHTSLAVLAHL